MRDGKAIARTTRPAYTDRKVKAGRTYRYSVRAYDKAKRAGAPTKSLRVSVPKAAPPVPTTNPVPALAPVANTPAAPAPGEPTDPGPAPEPTLTEAMVERLFWRAGFGPRDRDRQAWTGKKVSELVDWMLSTPVELEPATKPPKNADLADLYDPLASDAELEIEWLYRMQRAINPLPDRLAFFWHRHWAISREEGVIPLEWVRDYRDRLLRFADFGANPAATFRQLAYEMTVGDNAMALYLNMSQNYRNKPNENYAREFMELFCLGPTDPVTGAENYSQDDVAGLAKAFTGWYLETNQNNAAYGIIKFVPSRFELTAKTFLGLTLPAVVQAKADGPATINAAVDRVLAQPVHAPFLIRKLWAEFIAAPIPQETLDALIATYTGSGFQLKPLLRGILTHPLIFESIEEPNLIKPPIVYLVGAMRALDVPIRSTFLQTAMNGMQQRVYRPPNVAGWEGGMSWLNTNTVQARWDTITRLQYLRYSDYYSGTASAPTAAEFGATPDDAFKLAYAAVNRPWLGAGTIASLKAYAAAAPATTDALRRQRFYTLQTLMLGGPDGQVM